MMLLDGAGALCSRPSDLSAARGSVLQSEILENFGISKVEGAAPGLCSRGRFKTVASKGAEASIG